MGNYCHPRPARYFIVARVERLGWRFYFSINRSFFYKKLFEFTVTFASYTALLYLVSASSLSSGLKRDKNLFGRGRLRFGLPK